MKYNNLSNQKIYIEDKEITSGGQGAIHKVTNSNSIAKIYKDLDNKKRDRLDEKIRFMISNPPFDSSTPTEIKNSIVWPTDVLYDRHGFVGFVMPFVKDSIELSHLVFVKKKQSTHPIVQRFKKANNSNFFRQRLIMCYNLASVLKMLHQRNQYVVVDLKPQNILIDIAGTIVLIDIDSIQVKTYNSLYPADAWTDDYAPPEFHNRQINPMRGIDSSWDYFAFASTAYQLLFQIPAFMGSVDGHTTIIENISKNYFPHGKNRRRFRVIPKPHQEFRQLNSDVKSAFIDSFDNTPRNRPDFGVWVDCLVKQIGSTSNAKNKVQKPSNPPPLRPKPKKIYSPPKRNKINFVHILLKVKAIWKILLAFLAIVTVLFYSVRYAKEINKIEVYNNIFNLENHYIITKDKIGKTIEIQIINHVVWEQHIIKSDNGNIKFGWIREEDL